jgi:hypothetical protein
VKVDLVERFEKVQKEIQDLKDKRKKVKNEGWEATMDGKMQGSQVEQWIITMGVIALIMIGCLLSRS